VDDDLHILSALQALLHDTYDVFTTTDPQQALELLARQAMHVIISDQRMPVMTGVNFLSRSRKLSPHSVRILLTGYSDLAAIVGSINEAQIYRFISKPWDDDALLRLLKEASSIGIERSQSMPRTQALPKTIAAAVLVVDQSEELFLLVRELLHGVCPTLHAQNSATALSALSAQPVAVLVIYLKSNRIADLALLQRIKQDQPHIQAIAVIQPNDSQILTDLVNRVQIFRVANQPLELATLNTYLHEALQAYLTLSPPSTPVAVTPLTAPRSNISQRLLANLKWFGK
jgi:eukaryotic-like serine/threonine-protein kinase